MRIKVTILVKRIQYCRMRRVVIKENKIFYLALGKCRKQVNKAKYKE